MRTRINQPVTKSFDIFCSPHRVSLFIFLGVAKFWETGAGAKSCHLMESSFSQNVFESSHLSLKKKEKKTKRTWTAVEKFFLIKCLTRYYFTLALHPLRPKGRSEVLTGVKSGEHHRGQMAKTWSRFQLWCLTLKKKPKTPKHQSHTFLSLSKKEKLDWIQYRLFHGKIPQPCLFSHLTACCQLFDERNGHSTGH